MNFFSQLDHVKKYAQAFWAHDVIDHPYIAIRAPKTAGHSADAWSCGINPAHMLKACEDGQFDSVLGKIQDYIDDTYFAGEEIPHVDISIGPDQYAACFGGKIVDAGDNSTTWIKPFVDDLEEYTPVLQKDGYFDKLKTWLSAAFKHAEGKYLIDMLDLHGNMDTLSAVRGATDLCYDIIDCPEDVHRTLDLIEPVYKELYDMAYSLCNMEKYGTIGWHPVYCEGKGVPLQCDFSCLLSPEQGKEFVFPKIREEADLMEHCMYHLDGKDALCHLDTILDIDKIDYVQWVPGAGQPKTMKWMEVLHRIQAAGKGVWIFDWTVEEIKAYHKELKPNLVAYTVNAASAEEADELVEFLNKNT